MSSGSINLGYNSSTTYLNEDVYVNSENGGGVRFGATSNARVELASSKSILVGSVGFGSGVLNFGNIYIQDSSDFNFTLTDAATFAVSGSAPFNGKVSIVAPKILISGGVYNDSAYFEQTGSFNSLGNGSAVFNSHVELVNSGSGEFKLGGFNGDEFNGTTVLTSEGSGIIELGSSSSTTYLNGNIYVNSTNGGGVYFGSGSGSRVELGAGTELLVGDLGFASGELQLGNFYLVDSTEFSFILTGTSSFSVSGGSSFNGKVHVVAPSVLLDGGVFNDSTYFEQTGSASSYGDGSAVFNGYTEIVNSGSGGLMLGHKNNDYFNSDVVFTNTGTSYLRVGYSNADTTFCNGNVYINNTNGGGVGFGGGTEGTRVRLAAGKSMQTGELGFGSGELILDNFYAASAFDLNLTGTAAVSIYENTTFDGPVHLVSPAIKLDGGVFNDSSYIEHTGAQESLCAGSSVFNGYTEIVSSGSASLVLGQSQGYTFNSDVAFTNTGASYLKIGYSNTDTIYFHGNVYPIFKFQMQQH